MEAEVVAKMDEFSDLEKELKIANSDGRPGYPVKDGAFKGWRAFGTHPFSQNQKKNLIRDMFNSEIGLLAKLFLILLGIFFIFMFVLTITNPVMWVVGILVFVFSSFNNLMIKIGWLRLAKCEGKYILWDGKNVFALPLKYGRSLVFTSKDIQTITVEYGHSERVHICNRDKGNANVNFHVGIFTPGIMSNETHDQLAIDKQQFVKILSSATGLEPNMVEIYRGS